MAVTDGGRSVRIPVDADAKFGDLSRLLGLGIETVSISGHVNTKDDDVFAALRLDQNRHLLALDAEAAVRRIEQLPWVASAAVAREFPNELRVTITERDPVAVWQRGKRMILVDASGRVLGPPSDRAYAALPVVSGAEAGRFAADVLRIAREFPRIGNRVTQFDFIGRRRWSVRLRNGPVLHLPAGRAKLAIASLMQRPDVSILLGHTIAVVDLRSSRGIVVRKKQG